MRLIDADALKDSIVFSPYAGAADADRAADIKKWIDNQPTVERESVLICEGCKYWDKESGLSVRLCEFFDTYTKRNDWCSNAKAVGL